MHTIPTHTYVDAQVHNTHTYVCTHTHRAKYQYIIIRLSLTGGI